MKLRSFNSAAITTTATTFVMKLSFLALLIASLAPNAYAEKISPWFLMPTLVNCYRLPASA